MRDIVFRGKKAESGEWCYGYLVPFPDGISGFALVRECYLNKSKWQIYAPDYHEVLHDTIGQYTGMTDYFNTPVFEGDIIDVGDIRGVIRYGEHQYNPSQSGKTDVGFYVEWVGKFDGEFRSDIGYWLNCRDAVIRGNIWDNRD